MAEAVEPAEGETVLGLGLVVTCCGYVGTILGVGMLRMVQH